jgi:hypothetical protein
MQQNYGNSLGFFNQLRMRYPIAWVSQSYAARITSMFCGTVQTEEVNILEIMQELFPKRYY